MPDLPKLVSHSKLMRITFWTGNRWRSAEFCLSAYNASYAGMYFYFLHSSLESYSSIMMPHKQNKALLASTVSTDSLLWRTAGL